MNSERTPPSAAAQIGGRYHCLGELDGRVVYDKPTLAKANNLLRKIAPTLLFTHAPADYMIDHEMVSLLARSVSFVHAAPNISTLPLLEGTRIPYLY